MPADEAPPSERLGRGAPTNPAGGGRLVWPWRMPTARLAAAATLLVLGAPGVASGATVSVAQGPLFDDAASPEESCSRYAQCGTLRVVTVTAAPGEANDVAAALADPSAPLSEVTVRDAGAPLELEASAAEACALTGPGEVRCRAGAGGQGGGTETRLVLRAGDGSDTATVGTGLRAIFDGGAGDDVLSGADGADRLTGGSGADRLTGAAGDDRLSGGSGRDALSGATGEDLLIGGTGADAVSGGTGADRALLADRSPDTADCGTGTDRTTADRADRLRRCERVTRRRAARR